MPTTLHNLTLDELSLVDEPANKGARVCIFKRGDNQPKRDELMTNEAFEKMTKSEMDRGCTETVAKQRILHGFGPRPDASALAGSQDTAQFMRCVDAIRKRDACSGTEAMGKAREEHPEEFRKMRNC